MVINWRHLDDGFFWLLFSILFFGLFDKFVFNISMLNGICLRVFIRIVIYAMFSPRHEFIIYVSLCLEKRGGILCMLRLETSVSL